MRSTVPFLAGVLTAASLLAQPLPQGLKKVTTVEGITEYALPNGLQVLLFPDASSAKLTVNMTYKVGSRHEGNGESGMAHLLEHLLFLQTDTRASIKKELTDHGAQWNGSTSWDRTNYFETANPTGENLKWAIELEADRMLHAKIEKSILNSEMTVVRNEFEAGENNVDRMLSQRALESAYTFHSYGRMVIGSRADIENVPIEKLQVFYQKYYQPDNAVLTVAGKFSEPEALALISKAFSSIPRPSRVLDKTYTVEPVQDGERQVTLRRVGDVQGITAIYHIPAGSHPDAAALQVLGTVLGDSPSGRLYKALVDNQKAVSAGMFSIPLHDPGFAFVSASVRKDQSLDEATRILITTIEGLVSEPPTKEEVERAKTKMLKQVELQLANTQSVGLVMSEAIAIGDWRFVFHQRDQLKKVTDQDVLRVAKAYFKPSNRTVGQFIPTEKPDRAEIPTAPDAAAILKDYKGAAALSEGESFDPSPAAIESRVTRVRLPSGMKTVLLPKKTRGGTVMASVSLRFGSAESLREKAMVASTTASLLMRGTQNKSRQQIQDESDRLKARIGANGSSGTVTVNIETTEANLPGALRLAAEILRTPSFPENEFTQIKQQRLAAIEKSRSEPQMLAMLEMQRHLSPYPRGDVRYGATFPEQIEDIQKVTLDQVKQFHSNLYGASDAELVVTGQFNKDEISKLAAELFGDWKSPARYQRLAEPFQKREAVNRKIETPDKQNAMVIVGLTTRLSDEDAAFPAMQMASFLLGGSGGSRLYKRIRDKEGLSYGLQCQLAVPPKQDSGVFLCLAISAPQNSPKVEASFKDEFARTLKDGFTAEEVEAGKKAFLEQRKLSRSSDQSLVSTLSAREHYGRTMRFDEAMETNIASLTVDQVNEAFRKQIDPALLSVTKAGDFVKAGVFQ